MGRRPKDCLLKGTTSIYKHRIEWGHKWSWVGWAEARPGPEPPGVKRVLPKEKSATQRTARPCAPAMHLLREIQSSAHACSYDDGYGPLLWRKDCRQEYRVERGEHDSTYLSQRENFKPFDNFKNSTMHYCQQGLQNHLKFINVPAALVINTQWFSGSLKCIIGSFFGIKNSVLQ